MTRVTPTRPGKIVRAGLGATTGGTMSTAASSNGASTSAGREAPPHSANAVAPVSSSVAFRTRPGLHARLSRLPLALWRARWILLRLALASFLLWVVAADTGARLARIQLAALPGFDYVGEIQHLRDAGRFGDAISIADAGLASTTGDEQVRILEEKQETLRHRDSLSRRLGDVGWGALTGGTGPRGEASLEHLGGALVADLFVVGDVRDILIQGSHLAVDGETDEVILALSVLGLATTLAPEVDWVPSLLKIAKRAGTMSQNLQAFVRRAVQARRFDRLEPMLRDLAKISEHTSPGTAVRLLAHVDTPADAARLARFLERHSDGSRGALALHVGGKDAAEFIKRADSLPAGQAKQAENVLIAASKKGRAGTAWLGSPWAAKLMRPHPLIGLTKGLWKGNVESAVRAALDRSTTLAWWLLPLLGVWTLAEGAMLTGRVGRVLAGRGGAARTA